GGTQIFFNGILVGTSTDSVAFPRLRIGARGGGPADWLDAVLDESVVFGRALTDAEIIAHAGAAGLVQVGAIDPSPADGVIYEDTWASLGWSPGYGAASHDVYFGENFEDVDAGAESTFQGNQATTFFVVGFPGFPYPDGLVPGTTYYWRIDEVEADGTTIHKGDIWSFMVPPRTAYNPNPPDGVKFVALDTSLIWTAGFGSKMHTAYFGDNFDDVNNAVGGIPQIDTTYSLETLAKDKTYYWRVDEFDAVTTHKGDVWSFTTLPEIAITDPSLAGWWKLDEGQGTTAVDWSGHDNHGTLVGDPQWVAGYDGVALELDGSDWLDYGNKLQITEAITIACWIRPAGFSGDRGFVARDGGYALKSSSDHLRFTTPGILDHDGLNTILETGTWQHVAATFQPEQTGGLVFYINGVETERMNSSAMSPGTGPFRIGNNQWSQFYVGLIDDVRVYNKVLTEEEIQQAMRGDPLLAGVPQPSNGSTAYIRDATPLSWSPGDNASEHDVYFGTDKDAVADADASDTTGIYQGRQVATSYNPPEGVEWGGGPYYWRIDEYNTDGTISTGRIWSFTVADYLTVDDFEDYDTGDNQIWYAWKDGLGYGAPGAEPYYAGNGTGSMVGDETTGSYMEETIVHGGGKSMPLFYDNNTQDKLRYSEVEKTLSSPRDWTEEGVVVLSIWFYGDASNAAEPLYVALNGNAVVTHDNPNAAQIEAWTEWTIDLQLFADQGVNLANVNTIAIGLGNKKNPLAGGSGKIYIDDIRLYRPAP
ncbi:MAG: LamG-like jellyroll fold domain-containing protein, partial [Dehalococcoidales bacterium]